MAGKQTGGGGAPFGWYSAVEDCDYALTAIIEDQFDGPTEDPCEAEELCGTLLCSRAGCLKGKRDNARRILAALSTNEVG